MPSATGEARLSIGALSRATGIPVDTLRTWESRYGFPAPERKPSGHRLYPISAIVRLRRIASALSLGHRAGQVVTASEDALDQILRAAPGVRPPVVTPVPALSTAEMVQLVADYDGDRLTAVLLAEWARHAPVDFLEERVAPFLRAVGDAWEAGRLHVRHEHFASERVADVLRSVRLPYDQRAAGARVVLCTLSGEEHVLGVQMAAVVLAQAGWRVTLLGASTPVDELVASVRELRPAAVGIGFSPASAASRSAAAVRAVRKALPPDVALVVGGLGAPESRPGVERLPELRALAHWASPPAARSVAR